MSDKRYGVSCCVAGWLADGWTAKEIGTFERPEFALSAELARDLIAAQARIAELEASTDAVRLDAWKKGRAGWSAMEEQLIAAEATTARVCELTANWNKLADEADARQPGDGDCGDAEHGATRDTLHACADELETALAPPAKGGE